MKDSFKILISGYYGFDNFGDDAILYVIIQKLKESLSHIEITVISNNPVKIKEIYGVNSVYKFDFKQIFSAMKSYDLFISGGGSLLQDVTSFKSLIYYLFLIFLAKFLKKKTCIYAQGIGPIKSTIGKILTKLIINGVNLITVRDEKSHDFLKELGINSIITADPVWDIDNKENKEPVSEDKKLKIGIQLRGWHSFDNQKLEDLADSICITFNPEKYKLILFSLQDSLDLFITKKLESLLKTKNPLLDIKIISNLSIFDSLSLISSLDFLIAMRFHAVLVALKYNISTFAISYDPKVEILSKDAGISYISVENINQQELNSKFQEIILNKNTYISKLETFSSKKEQEARQNIDLLVKMLIET